ncbi:unnamed protein product [Timema podura]|uniref:Transposase n=1 Tax=Timema podura TaxID=61482 RepID=A0ABN7NVC8_TIMPD|nr:unnamed protein product [Timema podura]
MVSWGGLPNNSSWDQWYNAIFWKQKNGTSKRNIISPETMKAAVIKVVEGKGSINKTAKECGIDCKTPGRKGLYLIVQILGVLVPLVPTTRNTHDQ